jgi:uncharacterized membrane protein
MTEISLRGITGDPNLVLPRTALRRCQPIETDLKTFLLSYLATGLVFLGLDFAWLTVMGGPLYRAQLGDLMVEKFRPAPAIAFYLIYIVGIVVFVVLPARDQRSAVGALGHGMLLGLCAYATYDFTNLATVRNWPAALSIVDLVWGTAATGLAAMIATLVLGVIDRG